MLADYGDSFRYRESLSIGHGLKAFVRVQVFATVCRLVLAATAFGSTAKLIDKKLPGPGEGPSAEAQAGGHFIIEAYTADTSDIYWRPKVSPEEDPGYADIAIMVSNAALTLVRDDLLGTTGAFVPAVTFGGVPPRRLRTGGMTIEAIQAR